MYKLTKREEEYMQILWDLEKAFIKEIIAQLPDPKPHYNTVATIIKILEEKNFVAHVTFGNTHQYYALIAKDQYQQRELGDLVSNYFDNSYFKMVSYFAKNEKISQSELESIIDLINQGKK